MKKEDVRVTLQNGMLSIEGERKQEKEEKSERYHRVESVYGHFLRRFQMPEDIDGEKVEALFREGMLDIRVPKAAPKKRSPQQIAIG